MSNVFMQRKICIIVIFSSLITYSYFVCENQIEKKKKLTLTQLRGAPSIIMRHKLHFVDNLQH